MNGRIDTPVLVLVLSLGAVIWCGAALERPVRSDVLRKDLPEPRFTWASNEGLHFTGSLAAGTTVRFRTDGSVPTASDAILSLEELITLDPDRLRHARLRSIPTSVQWRHPVGGFPGLPVLRAAVFDEQGRHGPVEGHALPDASVLRGLPVVSLILPEEALFDPDHGIYVVGHAMLDQNSVAVAQFPRDQRWWKYPGNFLGRGSEWEREADLQYFDADGTEALHTSVRLRINGNNTRGFPQHALRVYLDAPSDVPLFGTVPGIGHSRMLLRTSGNDQDRTFFRDALQHELCRSLPFDVSSATATEVYVNGAYWGIHNLRERIDEVELARRHGLDKDMITILADRGELYRGKEKDRQRFLRLLESVEEWDASSDRFVDSVEKYIELDGALNYIAAQMILGNLDWPDQNVKYWRYMGTDHTADGPRDGRWRFIMGDSDLSFGYSGRSDADLFAHISARTGPVARLFKAMMRSAALRERFATVMRAQLDGPLSSANMTAAVDRFTADREPFIDLHIARWRRPLTRSAWNGHVADMRRFAAEREAIMRVQLDRSLAARP